MKRKVCKRGHLFTKENTFIYSDGRRECIICRNLRSSKRYYQYKEKYLQYCKNWQQANRKRVRQNIKEWWQSHPWYSNYHNAEQRCNNPNASGYENYGNKGILFLMTLEDFKYLWFRDKAYLMKRPSIHRNHNSNYILENCCFIELPEHCKIRWNNFRNLSSSI